MREGFLENLSLNLGPISDSGIDNDAVELGSVVRLMRLEVTSWSSSTPGAVEVRLAEDVAVAVGAGHGNEDATVSSRMSCKSEAEGREVSTPEAGENGAFRPGESGSASSWVVLR